MKKYKLLYEKFNRITGELEGRVAVKIDEICYIFSGVPVKPFKKNDKGDVVRNERGLPVYGESFLLYKLKTNTGDTFYCVEPWFISKLAFGTTGRLTCDYEEEERNILINGGVI